MARRKKDNKNTTISILWEDKEEFRKYAEFVRTTKSGARHESDADLFHKILKYYKANHPTDGKIKSTYPFQGKSQQDSDSSESN